MGRNKKTLDQAPSQREYAQLIKLENQDLQIREQKHECYLHYKCLLSSNPHLLEQAHQPNPDPDEAILSFFDETREELEKELGSFYAADPMKWKWW